MGTRGPKSQDELTVQKPQTEVSARMDADYSLRDEESDIWKAITESLPADWVNPGNAPILAAYCRATVSARRIGQLVYQAEDAADFDPDEFMKLVAAHSKLAQTIKTLATSLRLTPQARSLPKQSDKARVEGKKPWEQ